MATQHLTANDLMMGDWIMYSNKPVRVLQLTADKEYKGFFPIPLTPEILEKNGFGYIEKDEEITHFYQGEPHFCRSMTLHIGTNNQGGYWLNTYSNTIFGLRFVHELQHALKLCGIDKTIEL
mgnify:CR=1 FL=1